MEQASGAGWGADRIARLLQGPAELPLLHVAPSARLCSDCGAALRCLKSSTRSLTTLATGTVRVRELRTHCPDCGSAPLASRQLASLAPPGQRFGYDLIVWVGLQRYLHLRQRCEMRADLARRGITLSAGSLSALADRFLHLLGQLHTQRAPALRAAMQHGYPLHLDATSDKGKGGLFLCIDGWRGWVLHAVRIRSENEAELRPAIEITVALFGHPVAYMRDLGKAGANAVAACCQAPSVDLVCQFHLLAAIGRKLLLGDHAALQRGLTRFKVRSSLREWLRPLRAQARLEQASERDRQLPALLLWLLEGDGRKRACFPFGLAHLDFHQRCCRFEQVASQRLPGPLSARERGLLDRVRELLQPLRERAFGLAALAERLKCSQAVFAELRQVLRLRHDALRGRKPAAISPPPGLKAARLDSIASSLQDYRAKLRRRVAQTKAGSRPEAIVLDYLDRYYEKLVGHPRAYDGDGQIVAVVERTNNSAEHRFASAKRKLRRRVGRANLGRDMQDQPAEAALAANLHDEDYVRALCGNLDELPKAFANLVQSGAATARPALDRDNPDADLRRCIRAWGAKPAGHPKTPGDCRGGA